MLLQRQAVCSYRHEFFLHYEGATEEEDCFNLHNLPNRWQQNTFFYSSRNHINCVKITTNLYKFINAYILSLFSHSLL